MARNALLLKKTAQKTRKEALKNVRILRINFFCVFESKTVKLSTANDRALCRRRKRTDGGF